MYSQDIKGGINMWEKDMNINDIFTVRSKTTAYLGCGAIKKMYDIADTMAKKGLNKVVAITGRSAYKTTGAWDIVTDAFNKSGIEYILYDKITPNPEHTQVDEATKLAKDFGAKAVIGIGGGSPIDASKSIAILINYPQNTCQELYEHNFTPESAVPIIAINLTHGTGTEVDRFAVVSIPEKNKKIGIAYEFIYPMYAIDDPALMVSLPKFQTMAVSVDAINHVFEACTSRLAQPFTILCAKETVRLIYKYLPIALEDGTNIEARHYLAYAAMIAGISFDNTPLHFTHALEHPLSAVKTDLTHGLGLAILLPAVVRKCFDAKKETIIDVFKPMLGDNPESLNSDEAANLIKAWLSSVGANKTLRDEGFTEDDIDKLTDLVSTKRLNYSAPVESNRDIIRSIYEESL